jgi:hypothetical protein
MVKDKIINKVPSSPQPSSPGFSGEEGARYELV